MGPLLLAATPLGLVRVAFAAEGHAAVLAQLAGRIGPRILEYPPGLEDAGLFDALLASVSGIALALQVTG